MEIGKLNLISKDISYKGYVKKGMISHFESEYGQILLDDTYILKDKDNLIAENPYTAEFVVDIKDFSNIWAGIAWVKRTQFPTYSFLIRNNTDIFCGASPWSPYSPYIPLQIGPRYFISVVCNGTNQTIWRDGHIWITRYRRQYNFSEHSPTCGNVKYNSDTANVHCVRVYNRTLNDDEIIKNYQIDKARFTDNQYIRFKT